MGSLNMVLGSMLQLQAESVETSVADLPEVRAEAVAARVGVVQEVTEELEDPDKIREEPGLPQSRILAAVAVVEAPEEIPHLLEGPMAQLAAQAAAALSPSTGSRRAQDRRGRRDLSLEPL